MRAARLSIALCLILSTARALPPDARDLRPGGAEFTATAADWELAPAWGNARLRLEYLPGPSADAALVLPDGQRVALVGPAGEWRRLDVAAERLPGQPAVTREWREGKLTARREGAPATGARHAETAARTAESFRWDRDFTLSAEFTTTEGGTLAAVAPAEGKWAPDARALFIRDGRLVHDIGWLGDYSGGPKVNDGKPHRVALVVKEGAARLWIDGKPLPPKKNFTRPQVDGHVFKVGSAAPDFGGDFQGEIAVVRFHARALGDEEAKTLSSVGAGAVNTPDFEHRPGPAAGALRVTAAAGHRFRAAWTQPLDRADHAALIGAWDAESLARGKAVYEQLCTVCHGTRELAGSLPTALRFGEAPFKNGGDPFAMHRTLVNGYGQMVPQPQYTARQKYDVIHYIRETFLKDRPAHFTAVTPEYLADLPVGFATVEAEKENQQRPHYERMEFGSALFWTLEVAKGNIAQKGLTLRLDEGPGGISRGSAWMVYDHDTLRAAAGWSGDRFVDWRGIAFDGSHGTHTRIGAEAAFVNPDGPGWAHPESGSWQDPRPLGRDGVAYGPLPKDWVNYRGLHLHGTHAVLDFTVGRAEVLETASVVPYGATPTFVRTLRVGPSERVLRARVAPDQPGLSVESRGPVKLVRADGFVVAEFPAAATNRVAELFVSRLDAASLAALARARPAPVDPAALRGGGPNPWPGEVVTRVKPGEAGGAFTVDTLESPETNPWSAWMRLTGFDFTADGASAAVSTWNGDVWRVDGLDGAGELRWRRLVAGLFQPLGVKFRGNDLFISCRDQIARLEDRNGDGATDFIAAFNHDHQVTEHFHEFAMGLQTDAEGNFYYAKSARHALTALVPHHGTLLKVSADGARTEILATGFRAANGVCLNPDGSFFVTDQEGHWTPKNRINRVVPGGFYGNIFGYTSVTNTADDAMSPPMVWITNDKDRSPAELLWVPKGTWGPLAGSLLNLSYGYGRVYLVPHETVNGVAQGGVIELPIPDFPTGVMRGRFHANGDLYMCGMVGWATNCRADGGFYRMRPTAAPARLPLSFRTRPGELDLIFSDPLPAGVTPAAVKVKAWDLTRSAKYGSKHENEAPLTVASATLAADGKRLTLGLPGLKPTRGMEIAWEWKGPDSAAVKGNLHLTVHAVGK